MDVHELLIDLYGRVSENVHDIAGDCSPDELVTPPEPGANTIGWLLWHLTRVQDHHLAELIDEPQVWVSGDWAGRFGLEPDPHNTGYGHDPDDVATVRPESGAALIEYHDAVAARTDAYLAGLVPADLDRVVDRRWDPPVTLGVRLISVADDDCQHAGQAAYAKGVLRRR